jgi:hypothetical protein
MSRQYERCYTMTCASHMLQVQWCTQWEVGEPGGRLGRPQLAQALADRASVPLLHSNRTRSSCLTTSRRRALLLSGRASPSRSPWPPGCPRSCRCEPAQCISWLCRVVSFDRHPTRCTLQCLVVVLLVLLVCGCARCLSLVAGWTHAFAHMCAPCRLASPACPASLRMCTSSKLATKLI